MFSYYFFLMIEYESGAGWLAQKRGLLLFREKAARVSFCFFIYDFREGLLKAT
jgi:hypothetical protein